MTARPAGKKRKSVNEPANAKDHGFGISISASMEQKTGKPPSAVKKAWIWEHVRCIEGAENWEGILSSEEAGN